ncbi:hypothetical protein COT42_04245 [Candidatus Saganbacteria bacterium CG08_land_8_20_14_0_20_45_16]|uniref:Uncharacterized protein n=1 Tax=Candidatus Saganbacteria bacterium CG08_land_8_20_14_0_20_45_16 TaxID=2014293 RepID=A0A2H0XY01_UNCSA|nr:MAG: hypothetical protein COT42_04245 [Candidatus Saganbacteria bacterium CG08_land_8_20_14_0_20_45_16]
MLEGLRSVPQLLRSAVRAVRNRLPSKAAGQNQARVQTLRTNLVQNQKAISWRTEQLAALIPTSENYDFTLGQARLLQAGRLEMLAELASLGRATMADIAAYQAKANAQSRSPSVETRLQDNQKQYQAMELRLQTLNANDPSQSSDRLFTLNRIQALQQARIELLQQAGNRQAEVSACHEQGTNVNQERAVLLETIKGQLAAHPQSVADAENGMTRKYVSLDRVRQLYRDLRQAAVQKFQLTESLASSGGLKEEDVVETISALRGINNIVGNNYTQAATAQQHQLLRPQAEALPEEATREAA